MTRHAPLRQLLGQTEDLWNSDHVRPSVREAFAKVLTCGTPSLGAEVFASSTEERVVYHTCKSRACPSCGYRATVGWQRDLFRALPNVPYAHVTLTMPDVLWPLFRFNRHLLHDLPVLGAEVLRHLFEQKHGLRPIIVVILHTFGRHLNFNCHLHILVSQGGLSRTDRQWRGCPKWDRDAVMNLWRRAVCDYLRAAIRAAILDSDDSATALSRLVDTQSERRWIISVKRFQEKAHIIVYAGRYARRPPIAQHRFRYFDRNVVTFVTKDTRTRRIVQTRYDAADFVATLSDHVPDRYQHCVRYFGLMAPRNKREVGTVFSQLGQRHLGKPARLKWAASLQKAFGTNPLADRIGVTMRWARRLPPEPRRRSETPKSS